jgi:hypothetical protein
MNLRTRSSLVKTVFYFLSPFVLTLLFCLVGFIINENRFQGNTTEWTYFAASLFFPALLIVGAAYLIIRLILK